jgi:hypothetical protein
MRYGRGFGKTGGLGRHANPIVAGDLKKRRGSRSIDLLPGGIEMEMDYGF